MPAKYDESIIDAICERIAQGEAVHKLLARGRPEGWPCERTFYAMLQEDRDGVLQKYTRAKDRAAHRMATDLMQIADDAAGAGSGDVNRDRLRVDARKWVLARLAPKIYGDRQVVEHDGAVKTYVARLPDTAQDTASWLASARKT